ncbi:MAG: STM4012 family radical SAM protein [Flavobacteriales bacterium]|nr:STM4012 family radical SAM protein [Flavobacteriales bacterium]
MNQSNIYQQYAYSYPHKHAYRKLAQPINLQEVWKNEDNANLFAYMHIPFCSVRCGFCNLFTISNPKDGTDRFLEALNKEALTYRDLLPDLQFEEYAIGGGTPTFLDEKAFESMLSIFAENLKVNTKDKYGSIEASPNTINAEKIALIETFGIDRISMGVQSWIEEETKLLGRPQQLSKVKFAVENIAKSKVPEFNLDLIYGIHQQTEQTWIYSLERTLNYRPTEIYLYPLYTRPLTGLEKMQNQGDDIRLKLYRIGRDFLLENGYHQVSMRCFRRTDKPLHKNNYKSSIHGMVGIGSGARSYTKNLHYSTNYAVSRKATKEIIHAYGEASFEQVRYGIFLDLEERVRRFIIKSLIDGGSLDMQLFETEFNFNVIELDIINQLFEQNWIMENGGIIQLTNEGMEKEDLIGPMLFTPKVKELMKKFQLN